MMYEENMSSIRSTIKPENQVNLSGAWFSSNASTCLHKLYKLYKFQVTLVNEFRYLFISALVMSRRSCEPRSRVSVSIIGST